MPHSKGLSLKVLWITKLSWLSAVSSLMRTPSALPFTRLPDTMELLSRSDEQRPAAVAAFIILINAIARLIRATDCGSR